MHFLQVVKANSLKMPALSVLDISKELLHQHTFPSPGKQCSSVLSAIKNVEYTEMQCIFHSCLVVRRTCTKKSQLYILELSLSSEGSVLNLLCSHHFLMKQKESSVSKREFRNFSSHLMLIHGQVYGQK